MDDAGTVVIDCEAGRRLGCQNLCCQLFVPLSINELTRGLQTQSPISTLLRHDRDGYCSYLDRASRRCTIWHQRPLVCRRYSCNDDPKLQVVLREGMTSFGRLIEQAKLIPRDQWQRIPVCEQPDDDVVHAADPEPAATGPTPRQRPRPTPGRQLVAASRKHAKSTPPSRPKSPRRH